MPGQFMKQESLIGLNLICRNWSSIIGKQQKATTLCKKKIQHTGDTDSLDRFVMSVQKTFFLFSDPILTPLHFFLGPLKKRFSFVTGASIRIVQESQCLPYARYFSQSILDIWYMPIMELQFLQIKFNPIKLSCFINCPGMYFSVFELTLIHKIYTKKYKHVSNPLSCGKNILWINAKFYVIYSGQENNQNYIKELFSKFLIRSGYGGILNWFKKALNFHIFRMSWKLDFLKKHKK